jgi:hypothetical protein
LSELPLEKEREQRPRYPELEVSVVAQALKGFSVVQDVVPEKPYYIKFKSLSTGANIQGMTHAQGTKISPLFLKEVLERFDIGLSDFLEAMATSRKGMAIVRPSESQ